MTPTATVLQNQDVYRGNSAFVNRAEVEITDDHRLIIRRIVNGYRGGIELELADVDFTGSVGTARTFTGTSTDGFETIQIIESRTKGCGCGA